MLRRSFLATLPALAVSAHAGAIQIQQPKLFMAWSRTGNGALVLLANLADVEPAAVIVDGKTSRFSHQTRQQFKKFTFDICS